MLSVVTVNTDQDIVDPSDQLTSLREAIEMTNGLEGADQIAFDFDHDELATIRLEHGELELTDAVTIVGPGRDLLTIDAHHQSRIFNITRRGRHDFTIEGMTLTGARGDGRDDPNVGGAILSATSGLLTLRNSAITNSLVAKYHDGAAIAAIGDVAIESSIISGNIGSMFRSHVLTRGHVTISFSSIMENSGGIRTPGNVTIRSSTISRNGGDDPAALGYWMAVIESDGDVTVENSVISENSVSGIRASGNVGISSSTISANQGGIEVEGFGARIAGGIAARGDVSITSSTISGNTEGGIAAGGITTINSSTISGNIGGGISAAGNAIIQSSTIVGNFCGNGVCTHWGSRDAGIKFFRDLILENSIVAANRGGDLRFARPYPPIVELGRWFCEARGEECPEEPPHDPVWSVKHSLIGRNRGTPLMEAPLGHPDPNGNLIGGTVNGAIDPLHGPLRDNGGPTLTHALLPGSPAINMGDPSAVIGVDGILQFDQRREPSKRVMNGRIDMGAIESRPVGDSNGDGVFNSTDLVKVFQAGKFEDGLDNNANSDEGDWNGDGDFDTSDLVFAFQDGNYSPAAIPLAAVVDQLFSNDRDELLTHREDPLPSFESHEAALKHRGQFRKRN